MRHFCQIRRKRQSGIHDERDVLLMEKEAEVSPVLNFFIRDVTRHAPPQSKMCCGFPDHGKTKTEHT